MGSTQTVAQVETHISTDFETILKEKILTHLLIVLVFDNHIFSSFFYFTCIYIRHLMVKVTSCFIFYINK